MSEHVQDRAPVWRPPQDAAGFCKSHRHKPSKARPAAPRYHGPPLPAHIDKARGDARWAMIVEKARLSLAAKS